MKLLFGDLTGEKYKGDDLIYVSIEDEPEVVYKVVNNILPQFEEGLYGLAKYADIPTINEGNIEKLSIKGEKSTEFTLKKWFFLRMQMAKRASRGKRYGIAVKRK